MFSGNLLSKRSLNLTPPYHFSNGCGFNNHITSLFSDAFSIVIFSQSNISINLFTGERGLISFFEKKKLLTDLNDEQIFLTNEVKSIENKNNLLSNNLNLDLVDTLVREKFMFGKKNEVLIKINE